MIWLIGNKGMLGTELALLLEQQGIPYIGTDREVSILDPAALRDFARGKNISWIINCAAYTAVDKAEDDRELCTALNAVGPENLGRLAATIGASVLHISTDYVFSGSPHLRARPPAALPGTMTLRTPPVSTEKPRQRARPAFARPVRTASSSAPPGSTANMAPTLSLPCSAS